VRNCFWVFEKLKKFRKKFQKDIIEKIPAIKSSQVLFLKKSCGVSD
jgi:hypothetical protein